MAQNLLNYEGLSYFLEQLKVYIESLRTVKSVDTTASNGINLSNTNGTLDVTVTPGSVADGDTGLVTGDTVYDAIQAQDAFIVTLTFISSELLQDGTSLQTLLADKTTTEVWEALSSGKLVYAVQIGNTNNPYANIYRLSRFETANGVGTFAYYSGVRTSPVGSAIGEPEVTYLLLYGTQVLCKKVPLARLISPLFTGTPTAPTPSAGDDSTKIATTEFVNNAINATAPYIIESTNRVAEKSVPEIQALYYQTTSNIALRYNEKLYPLITFFDSNSLVWGAYINQTNFGSNTNIYVIELVGTTLTPKNILVNIVKSVNTTAGTSGINLSLSNNGELDVTITSGNIASGNTNFVTGDTVYNTTNLLAPKASPALTGTPTAPTAALGTNTTQLATTEFVTNTVINALTGKATFQGAIDSLNDVPNTYKKGYHWLVQTAGTYFGNVCEIGDMVYCVEDSDVTHDLSWSINDDFTVIQNNLDISIISNAEIDSLFTTESSNDSSNNG